jgi:hypothetical protein
MALLLKSKDIILRRTCTMPLIGQENPKRWILITDATDNKEILSKLVLCLGLRTLAKVFEHHRHRANA